MKNVDLFVGFDLSFNSSGLCFMLVDAENKKPITLDFQLMLFDKQYKPIRGVHQNKYTMPVGISVDDMMLDNINGSYYQSDQILITQKFAMAKINILHATDVVVNEIRSQYNLCNLIMSIEGFIAPSVVGNVQFRSLSGLIMMQGSVRAEMIQKYKDIIKLNVVSPTKLKLHFANNGDATKVDMLNTFKSAYDGEKLIDCSSVGKVNDVVDAFALNVNGFHKYYYTENYNKNYGDIDQIKHDKKIVLKIKRKAKLKRDREIDKKRIAEGKNKKSETLIIDHNQWIPTILD